jgi:hypothetical protein
LVVKGSAVVKIKHFVNQPQESPLCGFAFLFSKCGAESSKAVSQQKPRGSYTDAVNSGTSKL